MLYLVHDDKLANKQMLQNKYKKETRSYSSLSFCAYRSKLEVSLVWTGAQSVVLTSKRYGEAHGTIGQNYSSKHKNLSNKRKSNKICLSIDIGQSKMLQLISASSEISRKCRIFLDDGKATA